MKFTQDEWLEIWASLNKRIERLEFVDQKRWGKKIEELKKLKDKVEIEVGDIKII